MPRVLFLFLDGVGIGPDDPALNPFLRASLPTLRGLLGGVPTLDWPSPHGSAEAVDAAASASFLHSTPTAHSMGSGGSTPPDSSAPPSPPSRPALALGLDATLQMDGTPQSGTGQIALLTGLNAAHLHGSHFGPWPPVKLRPLLDEQNLLRRACLLGHTVAFANAYPLGYPGTRSTRLLAAPPLAALSAGLLTRHAPELIDGSAVASEIENTLWQRHAKELAIPDVTAEAAGENLGRIAGDAALTFFAHYATDQAGHGGRGRTKKDPGERMARGVEALERVDRFIAGILRTLDPATLLFIASDHGNIEDVSGEHTRNPALGILAGESVVGAASGRTPLPASIMDVPEAILGWLAPA